MAVTLQGQGGRAPLRSTVALIDGRRPHEGLRWPYIRNFDSQARYSRHSVLSTQYSVAYCVDSRSARLL